MARRYQVERTGDIEQADAAIFGELDMPNIATGTTAATHIALERIRPDLTQPRRAIPAAVIRRMAERETYYTGDPAQIPAFLREWHTQAGNELGVTIDLHDYMVAGRELDTEPDTRPTLRAFVDLLKLAASIHQDGLANPITVARHADGYIVETGERRTLAYHLLRLAFERTPQANDYAAIPARILSQSDVWRQAAENGARRPLNAIGMARQLALLIMDQYRDEGVTLDINAVVLPGECDRAYYAQVADGETWRIKRGFLPRILDVTGLKSRNQISQYRALLSIPDELWDAADAEDWPEYRIREALQQRNRPADTLTAVNVSQKPDSFSPPPPPAHPRYVDEDDADAQPHAGDPYEHDADYAPAWRPEPMPPLDEARVQMHHPEPARTTHPSYEPQPRTPPSAPADEEDIPVPGAPYSLRLLRDYAQAAVQRYKGDVEIQRAATAISRSRTAHYAADADMYDVQAAAEFLLGLMLAEIASYASAMHHASRHTPKA